MYLEREVGEILKWAEEVASGRGTSCLNVLIEFGECYKFYNDVQVAKYYVESAG